MVLSGRSLPQTSRHGRLHSARLHPCASSFSEEVVEGNHHIMAEGTGLEPYSPCQGLVRGQGGFEDVHACVDLPVHFPVAHQADEHLAHPISAPSATHGAGLTGPLRVDSDDRHGGEGGLVFDLTMDLGAGPRGQSTVHLPRPPTRAVEREVLEDDRRLILDEIPARTVAEAEGREYTGLLGLLLAGVETGAIPASRAREILEKLARSSFRMSSDSYGEVLLRLGVRA